MTLATLGPLPLKHLRRGKVRRREPSCGRLQEMRTKAAKNRPRPRSVAGSTEVSRALERGRAAYQARQWRDAFESLATADRAATLAGDDLERLAWSAALSGHDDEQIAALERLYQVRLEAGENLAAHPAIAAAEVLNFHWVTEFQSPESIGGLLKLDKLVVWTLHDQRPMTGGCHYSAGCGRYAEGCLPCPQ